MATKLAYRHYFWKATKWFVGNAIFGLSPLLFSLAIYGASEHAAGKEEINHLIRDGVVLFVCIAIMGSVMVEFFISGFKFSGKGVFAIYIFPLGILGLVCLDCLLIQLKIISGDCFDLNSLTTQIVISFSTIYSILAKANLYIKEDLLHG